MIATASDLIDRLGGNGPVSELLGVVPSAVSNYRRDGAFPAWTRALLAPACEAEGIQFPEHLFNEPRRPGPKSAKSAAVNGS